MAQITNRGKNRWLVRVFLGRGEDGKPKFHNKTIHGNKKDAQGYARDKEKERDTGVLTIGAEDRTIGGLLDDLVRDYRVNGKAHEWCSLEVEKQLRPFFGALPISKLSTDHVQRFVEKRRREGKANATINNELALLRRALNLGARATPPKVGRVIYIPKLKTNNVRKGFFEWDEFIALRAELPEEIRPVITFAYYTGCRRGEILGLQWPQVDLGERVVRLAAGETKNDEPRIIPLVAELYEVLAMQKNVRDQRHPDCPWVFSRDGKRIKDFKGAWSKACRVAGFWTGPRTDSWEKDVAAGGKHTKIFHDLRRTGARNLVRAGVAEKVVMAIGGWKTRSVFDRYNIVNEADLKEAARKLGEYLSHAESRQSHHSHTSTDSEAAKETVQ